MKHVGKLALAALLCASCTRPPRDPGTIVYASGTDLESANPLVTIHNLSRQLQRYALFVTLARYDSTLGPAPYFARSWRWSADQRTLTLQLDAALRWHDGTPTTARDAAFTLEAARDPATGYPRQADLAALDTAVAINDTTLELRFAAPQPSFPVILCELPIVPLHLLGRVPRARMRTDPFSIAPTGNGPFRFVRRDAGQRWVFARNPEFPRSMGGPPSAATLVVAVVDEPTTKFAGLVSGELDFAGIPPTLATLTSDDPTLRVISYPVLFVNALVYNTTRPPFDDVRIRRAVSLSIDRQRIIDAALAGFAIAASGPVSPDSPWAAPAPPATRDTARADSLFDAAGWTRDARGRRVAKGRPATITLLTVGSGDNAVEQLLQADLAARGVQVEIRQLEMGAFLALARAPRKTFDALVTGIPGDLSLAYLDAMFATRLQGGALDYAGFHRESLDSMLARARRAPTQADARAAWSAVQEFLEREMPVAWLYHSRGVQGASRRVRNVRMDLRGELVSVARWSAEPR